MTELSKERLAELRERVAGAGGPDSEIDGLIAMSEGWTYVKMKGDRSPYWRKPGATEFWNRSPDGPPPYTASIDAALSLVERMLPGWASGFDAGPKTHIAFVDPHDFADRITGARFTAEAPTTPIAILGALLSALTQDTP